jgi:hypothetical protein
LKGLETAALDSAVISDHMVSDAEQPRQCTPVVAAAVSATAKRADEDLSGEIFRRHDADPPRHVAKHHLAVSLVKLREDSRFLDTAADDDRICDC